MDEEASTAAAATDGSSDTPPDNFSNSAQAHQAHRYDRDVPQRPLPPGVTERKVNLFYPLPRTSEARTDDLDLPDPIFIHNFLTYFNVHVVGSPQQFQAHLAEFKSSTISALLPEYQAWATRNLRLMDMLLDRMLGVGRRFGLLGGTMQHLMLDPIPEHLMEDGTRWEPEVCDQEVVASLLWAMADGAKVVDMVETKPWTHWRKMRLVDFASIAARVMHGLKRAHAGYPAGVSVGGYTFMQRYSMIMELMRGCKGSVVRMFRPSTLEEMLIHPRKMKQRFIDNQVNNLKKKVDSIELRRLRLIDRVSTYDATVHEARAAGRPIPQVPNTPGFQAAYNEYLAEKVEIAKQEAAAEGGRRQMMEIYVTGRNNERNRATHDSVMASMFENYDALAPTAGGMSPASRMLMSSHTANTLEIPFGEAGGGETGLWGGDTGAGGMAGHGGGFYGSLETTRHSNDVFDDDGEDEEEDVPRHGRKRSRTIATSKPANTTSTVRGNSRAGTRSTGTSSTHTASKRKRGGGHTTHRSRPQLNSEQAAAARSMSNRILERGRRIPRDQLPRRAPITQEEWKRLGFREDEMKEVMTKHEQQVDENYDRIEHEEMMALAESAAAGVGGTLDVETTSRIPTFTGGDFGGGGRTRRRRPQSTSLAGGFVSGIEPVLTTQVPEINTMMLDDTEEQQQFNLELHLNLPDDYSTIGNRNATTSAPSDDYQFPLLNPEIEDNQISASTHSRRRHGGHQLQPLLTPRNYPTRLQTMESHHGDRIEVALTPDIMHQMFSDLIGPTAAAGNGEVYNQHGSHHLNDRDQGGAHTHGNNHNAEYNENLVDAQWAQWRQEQERLAEIQERAQHITTTTSVSGGGMINDHHQLPDAEDEQWVRWREEQEQLHQDGDMEDVDMMSMVVKQELDSDL